MTAPVILLLSGPNLNLSGVREPEVYGHETLADHVATTTHRAGELGFAVEHYQSNHEGELIDRIHAARGAACAIVANVGALTHTSWAIHDALAAFDGVVIELHLSNPAAREPFRHTSVIAGVSDGLIAGFGGAGYALAVDAVAAVLERKGASRGAGGGASKEAGGASKEAAGGGARRRGNDA